jgi:nitrogen regulatory protein PII 2
LRYTTGFWYLFTSPAAISVKEIIAIIRPGKWIATKRKLHELGLTSYTTSRVQGRGKQKGLRYIGRDGKTKVGMKTIPKRMVWFWVGEDRLKSVVQILLEVNRTGEIGDGKIFVCPAESALRVRTGERGEAALE